MVYFIGSFIETMECLAYITISISIQIGSQYLLDPILKYRPLQLPYYGDLLP